MKTWEQRRKRRPLGSVFWGQAPQKESLADPAPCLLPTIVACLAKKACQIGSKEICQTIKEYAEKQRENEEN